MAVVALLAALGLVACDPADPVVLSGQVTTTSMDDPYVFNGALVRVYANDTETEVERTVVVDEGRFSLRSSELVDGSYRIKVGSTWYGGTSWATATPVAVSTSSPAQVSMVGSNPSGFPLGAGNYLGMDLYGPVDPSGLVVVVYEGTTGELARIAELGTDDFAPGGPNRHFLLGLHMGSYRVAVVDPAGYWQPKVYGTTSLDPADGALVNLFGGWVNLTLETAACKPALMVPGADLSGLDLHNCDLSGRDLTGADLADADLTAADLSGSTLTGASLAGAVLTGANLSAVESGGITGAPAALPAPWRLTGGYLIGPAADLDGANLAGLDLGGHVLDGSSMTGTNLSGTDLSGATLVAIQPSGIVGVPAGLPAGWVLRPGFLLGPAVDLEYESLQGLDLSGLDLTGANLSWTILTGANLSGTQLVGSELFGVTSGGLIGSPSSLPAGTAVIAGYLVAPGARLEGADLSGFDLNGLDLTLARLSGADLIGTALVDATIVMIILSGANLTDADFAGAKGETSSWSTATHLNTTCPDGVVVSSPDTCAAHDLP